MCDDCIPIDDREIDPIDEADYKARIQCDGLQYWAVHRQVKIRRIGDNSDDD